MMWLVLICASFFELAFTVCMKLSNGLKNVKFTVLTVISSCASIGLLSVAAKTLPLGVSYAVWTGLGTLFNVLFGIIGFKESKRFLSPEDAADEIYDLIYKLSYSVGNV